MNPLFKHQAEREIERELATRGEPAIAAAKVEQTMPFRPAWKSPVIPWEACDAERRAWLRKAWEFGLFDYKMTPTQLKMQAKCEEWSRRVQADIELPDGHAKKRHLGRIFANDMSRRLGKSYYLMLRAFAKGAQNKNWRMVYLAPQYKMVRQIVLPLVGNIVQDCPPGLFGPGKTQGPEWVKSEDTFYFRHTNSRLELYGLDVNPDAGRGTAVDYVFGDEFGFFDNLEYTLYSIIYPQMLGRKHARIEAASTPPVSPSHVWSREIIPKCIGDGAHDLHTIEDADQYEVAEIEEQIRQLGGRDSITVRREFFCEHVVDDTLAVIPEFRKVESEVVMSVQPPQWRDCYEAMDPGWKDHTAVLFGYWDFENQRCVIEDEICAPRMNSADLAAEVKRKEEWLWKGVPRRVQNSPRIKTQPFMRVMDHDPRLQQDLAVTHGLAFVPTLKDNIEAQVVAVRTAFANKAIIINPRCVKLISHLKSAVWRKKDSRQFAWEGGDLGHFDTVAALVYLWRIMSQNKSRNPAPFLVAKVKESEHNAKLGKQEPTASRWTYRRGGFRVR